MFVCSSPTTTSRRGAYPAEDAEPTSDQLSAVRQVVAADAPPYADFAIFGPHGKRLLRKLMFTAWEQMPNGQWHKKELPGPPNLDSWWTSWKTLRTVLVMLDLVDVEHLDNYGEVIRGVSQSYGPDC